jgi:hypothetical protein
MTNQTFEEIVNQQLEICRDLLVVKGREYSLTDDRLECFKKAASLQGETVKQALCGMLAKHVVSVYDMCMTGGKFPIDKWTEKVTDSMNYLLLLMAAVWEEGGYGQKAD